MAHKGVSKTAHKFSDTEIVCSSQWVTTEITIISVSG